jgi:hypothetical protein
MCLHAESTEVLKGTVNLRVRLPDAPVSVGKLKSDPEMETSTKIDFLLRLTVPFCLADLAN